MTHPTFHVSVSWRAARHTRDAAAATVYDPTRSAGRREMWPRQQVRQRRREPTECVFMQHKNV